MSYKIIGWLQSIVLWLNQDKWEGLIISKHVLAGVITS